MKREETGDGEDNGEKKMDKYKYVWGISICILSIVLVLKVDN